MENKTNKEALTFWDKVKLFLGSLGTEKVASKPTTLTLAAICKLIDDTPNTPVKGIKMSVMKLGDYEYLSPPAKAWADDKGVDIDVAALAWALASEAPKIQKYPAYSVAIAEAILNASKRTANSVSYRTLRDNRLPELYFGRQPGRWCSTFQAPTEKHFKCAMLVKAAFDQKITLFGQGERWDDPQSQSYLSKKSGGKTLPPEKIVLNWAKDGYEWIGPRPELDPYVLLLFKKVAGPGQTAAALAAIEDGRKRWKDPV